MTGEEFVTKLKSELEQLLGKLDAEPLLPPARDAQAQLPALLRIALKNEAEAAEIAAAWVASTPELEVKLAFARHAGDEARHYQLVEEQVRAAGMDLTGFDPLHPPSPVLELLRSLETTAERVAGALVAREAMGARRNAQFLRLLQAAGQHALAALYRDVINPDEERHHRAGCELLARLAGDADAQRRARGAALALLATGDKAREALMQKTGAACVPGC